MNDRYFGKVVHIANGYSVVINAGIEQKVAVGMRFLIVGLGDLIYDPDTGEALEQLEIVRGRAEVVHVQTRLSTLKSIEVERQPDTREIKKVTSRNTALASLMGTQDVVTESIKPSESILLELTDVQIGDFVIKI